MTDYEAFIALFERIGGPYAITLYGEQSPPWLAEDDPMLVVHDFPREGLCWLEVGGVDLIFDQSGRYLGTYSYEPDGFEGRVAEGEPRRAAFHDFRSPPPASRA